MCQCTQACICKYSFALFNKEDFLDLSVAVTDCTGLEDSLSAAFIHKEFLRDANMYNCSNCNRLTNANKVRTVFYTSITESKALWFLSKVSLYRSELIIS